MSVRLGDEQQYARVGGFGGPGSTGLDVARTVCVRAGLGHSGQQDGIELDRTGGGEGPLNGDRVTLGVEGAAGRGDDEGHHAGVQDGPPGGPYAVQVGRGVGDDADYAPVRGPGTAHLGERGAGVGCDEWHGGRGNWQPEAVGDLFAQLRIDVRQHLQGAFLDGLLVALVQLEGVGGDDVFALGRGHAEPEEAWLGKVVRERGRCLTDLARLGDLHGRFDEGGRSGSGQEGAASVEAVGPVGGDAGVDGALVHSVAEHVVDGGVRPVDGDMAEVRAAESADLCVEVGEEPSGEQRVVGDVDAGNQVAGVEGDLFGLGEKVLGVGVQGHQPDGLNG